MTNEQVHAAVEAARKFIEKQDFGHIVIDDNPDGTVSAGLDDGAMNLNELVSAIINALEIK